MNEPNVMTPGAWVIIAVVAAAALAGIGAMAWRLWSTRIRWAPLGVCRAEWFSEPGAGVSIGVLEAAITKAARCLERNSKWAPAQLDAALQSFRVYVYADPLLAGKPGITGYEEDGFVGVNSRLTTLCHELGHLAQERIDRIIDYTHSQFDADGINKADAEYSVWLASSR